MAAFNPAAIAHEGKIHLFYRAQGHDHLSVVGYAYSEDGYSFEELYQMAWENLFEFFSSNSIELVGNFIFTDSDILNAQE
jgi:predicted GH43/DUF377 family glycosyl hydrolase